MDQNRYDLGLKNLARVSGPDGLHMVEMLNRISPDFADYVVEFPYGDIYERKGLDLKSRQLAAIAALTALGTARPQLEIHISAGLNVGCTRSEIIEVIVQTVIFAGFPAAINGLVAAQHVFDQRAQP